MKFSKGDPLYNKFGRKVAVYSGYEIERGRISKLIGQVLTKVRNGEFIYNIDMVPLGTCELENDTLKVKVKARRAI